MLSYFSIVSSLITLQMNCLDNPSIQKSRTLLQEAPVKLSTPDKITYSSSTIIILPFEDNVTTSYTKLCDSSPSHSRHSLWAAPDREQVPLLPCKLQLGLSLCWQLPRRVPQRTASLLVNLLFVFHRVALLLESRFTHKVYTRVYTIIKIGVGLFEMDCK